KGFHHAANAFSQFAAIQLSYSIVHEEFHVVEEDEVKNLHCFIENKSSVLITTEIIGDVFGKSYLLMTDQEFDAISGGTFGNGSAVNDIREEFIKELDNILSASVITKLANDLRLKIYGNVPIMIRPFSCDMKSVIADDFAEDASGVYITAIRFSLAANPDLKPCFVWVMHQDLFSMIESRQTT
ncbi:MAG TPA: hypothetical protein VIN08_23010, partial [Ohtaekwangia sp.]|uniref:hypothetical protein n=1 Tax=Ohtaekwangia sp. TaxID=2066019 RepID=UPI002F95F94A